MTRTAMLTASTAIFAVTLAMSANAETFRWASTTDPQALASGRMTK